MTGAPPREVYEARNFWVIEDVEGATWVVRPTAGWAQRRPYRGGVRGLHRLDEQSEDAILRRLVSDNSAAVA
jgi:hypothetical protein